MTGEGNTIVIRPIGRVISDRKEIKDDSWGAENFCRGFLNGVHGTYLFANGIGRLPQSRPSPRWWKVAVRTLRTVPLVSSPRTQPPKILDQNLQLARLHTIDPPGCKMNTR